MNTSETSSVKSGRRVRPLIMVGAAVVAVTLIFFLVWDGDGESASETGLVYETVMEPFTISISESGTIESRNRVIIKSEVPGQQTIIYLIPEGTMVKEGDLLVELDSSAFQDNLVEEEIELENAEAELISARENLEVVKNQAEADIAQARLDYRFAQQDLAKYKEGEYAMSLKQANSKIVLARAELQQAEDRLNGSRELFENRYISETELESDELAMQRARMDLELAEQEKQLLETYEYDRQTAQLESDVEQARLAQERAERKARANIAEAEARLSASRAEVQSEQISTKRLRTRIENCRITAPTDGMVVYSPQGNRWNAEVLEEGSSVRDRQELIYLPTASEMSAKISIHESMLNKVAIGQTATIRVDALPDRVFTGTVEEIAVMPEDGGWRNPDLKQYSTTIQINDAAPELRPGMTCNAEILVAHFDEALTVPMQSVLRVDGRPTVFVRDGDGGTLAMPVVVGMDNNRKIQVMEGLEAGASVLLNPPLELAERGLGGVGPPESAEETAETADTDADASGSSEQVMDAGGGIVRDRT